MSIHRAASPAVLPIDELNPRDIAAWRELAARSAEPNPFFEPECVLPAARYLGETRRCDHALRTPSTSGSCATASAQWAACSCWRWAPPSRPSATSATCSRRLRLLLQDRPRRVIRPLSAWCKGRIVGSGSLESATMASAPRLVSCPTSAASVGYPCPEQRPTNSPVLAPPASGPESRRIRETPADADVAQLVEHFTRNEGVPGSNPGVGSREVPVNPRVFNWRREVVSRTRTQNGHFRCWTSWSISVGRTRRSVRQGACARRRRAI